MTYVIEFCIFFEHYSYYLELKSKNKHLV